MTRRSALKPLRLPAFALLPSLLVAGLGAGLVAGPLGCARNPVTGKNELSLVSEAQEIQMGQQAAQEVAQRIGFYEDPSVQSYVADIGKRMAAKSERPNLPWEFHVVNDASVNAFALPGGFIYVTRGLMSSHQHRGRAGHACWGTRSGTSPPGTRCSRSARRSSPSSASASAASSPPTSPSSGNWRARARRAVPQVRPRRGEPGRPARLPLCAGPELRRAGDGERLRDSRPAQRGWREAAGCRSGSRPIRIPGTGSSRSRRGSTRCRWIRGSSSSTGTSTCGRSRA